MDLAAAAKQMGMKATAITDHGTLAGVPEFVYSCQQIGIKPIIGMEAYCVPDHTVHHTFKSPTGKEVRTGYHLVLLAKNLKGYHNLVQLNNIANFHGFYYSPKIDWNLLLKHKEGLIVSSACLASELDQTIMGGQDGRIVAKRFKDAFGDDYFIEVMDNGMVKEDQRNTNKGLIPVAKALDIKIIPTNDAHYLKAEHRKMHDVAVCMQSKKKITDAQRLRYDGIYHLKSIEEMSKLFPEYMKNTEFVAERIEDFTPFDKTMKLPVDISAQEAQRLLAMASEASLRERKLHRTKKYTDRLKSELATIGKLGLAPYFLTTKDIVDTIRSMGCPIGWGRGSAGGSLICYVLGITDVDPVQYGLLFERFVNENRPDWPDIDLDVPMSRRQEVIKRIYEKFGRANVSHISTMSYLKPKMLMRDICRAMDESMATANELVGMIPAGSEDFEDLKGSPLENRLQESTTGKFIWETLEGLMGVPRHMGMHASGIIIANNPVDQYLPMRRDKETNLTQYAMHFHLPNESGKREEISVLDKFGFLKFDVLGLTKLDIIFKTAEDVGINIKEIPLDDPLPYTLIAQGKVAGMFQLDSSKSCRDLAMKMKPLSIQDLSDLIALHRPGTMDSDQLGTYLRRRNGTEPVLYLHPALKEILEPNFGICIYQEDMMRMAQAYAEYTLAEAEDLRRAIGKKDVGRMEKHKKMFAERAEKLGRTGIDKVLDMLSASARYSFNKSHACSYAMITYACAYLSAHHPLEFFKNTVNLSNTEDRTSYLSDVITRGIKILPPDINSSQTEVSVEGDALRLGLMSIVGIGDAGAKEILEHRPYKNIQEVLENLSRSLVSRLHAAHALEQLPDASTYSPVAKFDEVQVLGIALHGMVQYKDVIDRIKASPVHELGQGGIAMIKITNVKPINDKKGRRMAFVDFVDIHGPKYEGVIFHDAYDRCGSPKTNEFYGASLEITGRGNYQIKFFRNIPDIKKEENI